MEKLKSKKLSKDITNSISGGLRQRIVQTMDVDGDGKWDIKVVSVYVDGILIRERRRFR